MDYMITHDPARNCFEMRQDGMTALVDYRLWNGTLNVVHTFVPRPLEGQGIAGALVKAAYDYALENGLQPEGSCSYAAAWLRRHPEYRKK